MADTSKIKEHAEVIGADGVKVGTVDRVEGDRIKLWRCTGSNRGAREEKCKENNGEAKRNEQCDQHDGLPTERC